MNTNTLVGIGLIIIGLSIAIGSFIGHVLIKRKNKARQFRMINQEYEKIWDYTKRNFLLFLSFVGLIISFTSISFFV